MTKFALLLAAAGFVAFAPAAVKAADDHAAPAAHGAMEAHTAMEHELADGTKVSVEGEKVFVVAADGTKTAAPDGEHTMKDGTKVKTKDGVIVK